MNTTTAPAIRSKASRPDPAPAKHIEFYYFECDKNPVELTLFRAEKNNNWNLYIDVNTLQLYYIAKDPTQCKSGWYGDIDHFKRMEKLSNQRRLQTNSKK